MPELDALIFCDDVRQETGNKVTLVGIYGRYLYLPKDAKFPAAVRQLCAYLRFSGLQGGEKLKLKVETQGDIVYETPTPAELKAPDQREDYSQAGLFLVPFAFRDFGDYSFKFFWEGREELIREFILHVCPEP